MIPATLARIVGDKRNRSVASEQVELPDTEVGRSDLRGRAAHSIDLEKSPPSALRIVDRRVLFVSPGQTLRAIRGAAVEPAIGGKHNDRGTIARPAQILDRAWNIAERLTTPSSRMKRSALPLVVRSEVKASRPSTGE